MTETVDLLPKTKEYVGFIQSAKNNTEVEIRIQCKEESEIKFKLEFVIRTSPCAKEFIVTKHRFLQINNLLAFYFYEAQHIPKGYNYKNILYYRSKPQNFSCKNHNSVDVFINDDFREMMGQYNVTELDDNFTENEKNMRKRREIFSATSNNTLNDGSKISLTSWHPAKRLPVDSMYLLILKFTVLKFPTSNNDSQKIKTEIQWREPHGYLSAIDYPLLKFYAFMCIFYVILGITWFTICFRHWRDLLRIQYWIAGVIIVGMIEKTIFYIEYFNMNKTGRSIDRLIELAELVSCLKRTMAHVLIIVVSVGYGVVKPRLGSTLNQIFVVGILYFLFCSLEGFTRVSRHTSEILKEKQLAKIPLACLEFIIIWWIFSLLVNTMRTLKMRKNQIKLNLYKNFTNVIGAATFIAVIYMCWSIYMHSAQYCMKNWQQLWMDTAFWHVFFCVILVAIIILWRPAQNNQRYAFTPLLDDSENEDDDDELFDGQQVGVYQMLKQRTPVQGGIEIKKLENISFNDTNIKDEKLKEDFKWIEANIPTLLVDALIDGEEEKELRELEMSKIL